MELFTITTFRNFTVSILEQSKEYQPICLHFTLFETLIPVKSSYPLFNQCYLTTYMSILAIQKPYPFIIASRQCQIVSHINTKFLTNLFDLQNTRPVVCDINMRIPCSGSVGVHNDKLLFIIIHLFHFCVVFHVHFFPSS